MTAMPIYEPKGKAREYSPLALNLYNGCDHGCRYCYNRRWEGKSAREPIPVRNVIARLKQYLESHAVTRQVLLSFVGDPYCHAELEHGITRQALELLDRHRVPTAILTKGGMRAMRDLDLMKRMGKRVKIGATLTFAGVGYSSDWEPGAAAPEERLAMLEMAHKAGIQTFASLEPVISPEQSLAIMRLALPYVDQFKVGRWNHDPRAGLNDWYWFACEAVGMLRRAGKHFYIKEGLRAALPADFLRPEECDADALALTVERG